MRPEGLARAAAYALALTVVLAATPACKRAPTATSCRKPGDASVVACVDGAPLARAFVEQFVREPWWVPGVATLPDPRREALGRAVRTTLFAAEAKRRGLALGAGAPDAPASWAQLLIADELQKRGISRASISDAEAQRHYEANQELFNQIDEVDAQVIAFDDPKLAERIYPEAAKADAAGFRALVEKHSVDPKTRAAFGDRKIIASTDEDRPMLRIALAVRKPGVVAGPFQAQDGRWYLLRIKSSPVEHAKPLDEVLRTTVKNALLDERRRALGDELDAALRAKAKVETFDDALAQVAVPAFP